MRTSEEANRVRWSGQRGFFEIWFAVVFVPEKGRALWVRYTLDAPAGPGESKAMLWAAAFEPGVAPRASKSVSPIAAFTSEPARFGIRIGEAELGQGVCRGAVSGIAWDLRFEPARQAAVRHPALLEWLPIGTQEEHANPDIAFSGEVTVEGERWDLTGARGLQMHIHGTRRVEELFWLYCPRFDVLDAAGAAADDTARLEVIAARPRRRFAGVELPRATSLWLQMKNQTFDRCGLRALPGNAITVQPGRALRVRSANSTRAVLVRAACDPGSLVGYVYRDPAGWDVHVAQSDQASCHVEVLERPERGAGWRRVRRLSSHQAALEFHQVEPIPGVRYLPWGD